MLSWPDTWYRCLENFKFCNCYGEWKCDLSGWGDEDEEGLMFSVFWFMQTSAGCHTDWLLLVREEKTPRREARANCLIRDGAVRGTTHCPATSIVKIFMPIEVIHLILTTRKNGFRKVVSDNLLMEGKFSYFNFNVLQCKKLAYFCKFWTFLSP